MRRQVTPIEQAARIVQVALERHPDAPVVFLGDWILLAAGIQAIEEAIDGRTHVRAAPRHR